MAVATTMDGRTIAAAEVSAGAMGGAVTGQPRAWLRIEGLAALAVGTILYLWAGGALVLLVPLLLAVDVSMIGYVAGPRVGALAYSAAHNWAVGLLALGAGSVLAAPVLLLAGAVLVGHVGLDRMAGYGLKYPTAFRDTHLGRIGR